MARPKKPPEDVETESPPIDMHGWEEWPLIAEAAEELGVAERTLMRRVKKGQFPRYMCPDGIYRYKPEDLEDAGSTPDVPEKNTQAVSAQLLEQATRMLSQAHAHNEKLLTLITDPVSLVLGHLKDHASRQDLRVEHLETKMLGQVELREALLSEQTEREIAKQQSIATEARKDAALDMAKQQLGPLLSHVLGTQPVQKKLEQLKKFGDSLDPDLIAMLTHPENETLTPDQKTMLADLLKKE